MRTVENVLRRRSWVIHATVDHSADENGERKTLAASFETDRGNQAIRGFVTTDAPNFKSMTCDAVDVLFAAASERMRERNNVLNTHRGPAIAASKDQRPQTPAELNAFYRNYYEQRDRGL
jgi:hypothetical protein